MKMFKFLLYMVCNILFIVGLITAINTDDIHQSNRLLLYSIIFFLIQFSIEVDNIKEYVKGFQPGPNIQIQLPTDIIDEIVKQKIISFTHWVHDLDENAIKQLHEKYPTVEDLYDYYIKEVFNK